MKGRFPSLLRHWPAAWAVAAFSMLPVLYFTKSNTAELKVSEAAGLVLFALVLSSIVWAIARLALRSWAKGALFAIAATFPAYHYVSWSGFTAKHLPFLPPMPALYGTIILFLALILILLRRTPLPRARTLTNYFAVLGAVLVFMNLVPAVRDFIRTSQVSVTVHNEDFVRAAADVDLPDDPPDIYYIVLDRYTGQLGLKERFGFDNAPFVETLRGKGFYVADASFANYPITAPSLASSLNAGLLEAHGPVEEINNRKPLHELVERPQVVRSLQAKGYEYALIGSWWGPTQKSPIANVNPEFAWNVELPGWRLHTGNAAGHFFTDTIFAGVFEQLGSDYTAAKAHAPIFKEQLTEVRLQAQRQDDTPKFVLAHILMPHPPYVFDATGRRIPASYAGDDRYVQQLRYTNREIDRLTDSILTAYSAGRKPIIVLAGDEGEYTYRFDPGAPDEQIRYKTNILNAFYFPGEEYGSLYPTITPVNTFRVVFNEFFGTDLPLRADHTTASPSKRPLHWVDVTDRVRR